MRKHDREVLRRFFAALALLVAIIVVAVACSSSSGQKTLYIGGIPDQDISTLEVRFDKLAEYLSEETGVPVKYLPSVDYSAVVTGFRNNDVQLAWYGGLTGVQARLAVPGAKALAQRAIDQRFTSVFIAHVGSGITSLADLEGRSFTFGSESSTSGHLMPRFFMTEAGLDPEADFSQLSYSGSHDRAWKLVEAGSFDAGALNANVWAARVLEGKVDLSKVDAFFTTPSYFDYHWVARPDLDDVYGKGFTQRLTNALLALDASNGGADQEIMDAFQASIFVPTTNEKYQAIESVARSLGIIE